MKTMRRVLVVLVLVMGLGMTSMASAQQTTINLRLSIQFFERGYMVWRADTGHIWVFGYGGEMMNFPLSSYARLPDNPLREIGGPVLGFGKVWGNHQSVRDLIGFGTMGEQGGNGTYTVISPSNTAFLTYENIKAFQIEPNGSWIYSIFNATSAQVTSLTATPTNPRVQDQITVAWQSSGGQNVVIEIYDGAGNQIHSQPGTNSGSIPIIVPNSNRITVMVWALAPIERSQVVQQRLASSSVVVNITGATATTPPPPSVTCVSGSAYIVQRGDTLYRIARRCGITVDALIARNGIVNRNRIFAGQRLIIP